jgi:prepilin-type processing-associated H-X9-DG protein/prepilin-type N-terminal cleavage/methylation domain-containing protein
MLPQTSATPRNPQPQSPRVARAFTLVELLVVIGIIVVLIAILLPALAAARRQGQLVRCQSNLRQIVAGFYVYADDNNHHFPAYLGASGTNWVVGVGDLLARDGIVKGHGLFTCPSDEDSRLSYSMNIWMSSAIDPWIPPVGTLWGPTPRKSSQVILLIESWSYRDNFNRGFSALPVVGYRGDTPGKRFGAGGGISPLVNSYRWGMVNCEIDYMRHRPRSYWAQRTQPGGIVNIAYVDGHVAAKSESELADRDSGLSTLDSLWSPLDDVQNKSTAAGTLP